jgi:diacylglycerol kinase (ATP)
MKRLLLRRLLKNTLQNEARRAAEAGFELIIAAGGDGTINEVVNGIAPLGIRPKLAIIPAGTTNDFARALKIPRNNPVAAARIIGKAQTLNMDVGCAEMITTISSISLSGG